MKRDLGLLLLRLGAGVTLMAHGYPKLFGGPESFAQALAQMGIPEPQVAAVLAGLAEFGGGLGLALGLGTRPAGLLAAANMAVAARKAHWPQGFYGQGGYEFPVLLGVVGAALTLTGPGAISIDRLFGRD